MHSSSFISTGKFIFLFIILLLVNSTTAQNKPAGSIKQTDKLNSEMLNEIGGWQFSLNRETVIDEDRNFAYLNSGAVVLILDISDVNSPVLVNDIIRTSGVVLDMYYNPATQNLYLALGEHGIEIWDMQNISSPQLLSSLFLDYAGTIPPANQITAKPGFIFVAADYAGVITINISDPANPFESGLNLGFGGVKNAINIDKTNNFIVAAGGETEYYNILPDGNLHLIAISPPLVGAQAIEIYNNLSFQISSGVLYVLDLPSLLVVSSYNLPGNSSSYSSMARLNDLLFISAPFFGIEIVDVSNPSNPTLVGTYQTTSRDVKYFSNHLFVPNNFGMNIIDVSDPVNPTLTSNYEGVGGLARDVRISGTNCYMVTSPSLYVLDVSNAANPQLIGSNEPATGVDLHIQLKDNYAYITNSEQGIRVVDISDPANPVKVGNSSPSYYNYMDLAGNYIYVTDTQSNLKVFSISNPTSPIEVGSLNLSSSGSLPTGIEVSNGYAYITLFDDGLSIVDVSDPSQPVLVSNYNQSVRLFDVAVKDNYVFTPDLFFLQSRIYTFDVSDPSNPVIAGTHVFSDPPPHAFLNSLYNNTLFVSDLMDPYITLMDVSDPTQTSIISSQLTADEVFALDITDNFIYMATFEAGLHIYENPFSTVPVELTSFTSTVNGNNVNLRWQTATESNNLGFEILRQRKSENDKWNKIGFVEGHGTTSEINNYSFADENLETGTYLYKLVQIDFDGTRNESEIINAVVDNQPKEFVLMQNYPNPFNPSTNIKYTIPTPLAPPFSKGGKKDGHFVTLKVYDVLGNEVATLVNEEKPAGTYEVNFDAGNITSGVYYYQLKAGSFVQTKKMLLLK